MPYRDGDYTYSVIDDYYRLTTTSRKDTPLPVTLDWETASGGSSQHIELADNPDFTDVLTYTVSGSAVSYDIYNLIPGKHYYWRVLSKSSETISHGEFITKGRRRLLKVGNICNIRDLGGIPIANSHKRIKYGLLFRGGEMNGYHQDQSGRYCRLDPYGKTAMRHAGIAAVLDLRTDDEAGNITVSPLGENVDYIRLQNANEFYYDKCWNSDVYIQAIQWIIDRLREGKPVYFHCIFGADRTGTLAFLLEALLGVNENQLAIDYELTSFSYGLESAPRRRGPKNELSVYRYRQMLEGLLRGSGTIQEQVRVFLLKKYPAKTWNGSLDTWLRITRLLVQNCSDRPTIPNTALVIEIQIIRKMVKTHFQTLVPVYRSGSSSIVSSRCQIPPLFAIIH